MNKRERIAHLRKAGQATSPRKAATSAENGKAGGRTPDPEIARIMRERGCSRSHASRIKRGLRR